MNQHFELTPEHQDYVELIQITDTHIFADAKDRFDDVDTEVTLNQILDLARNKSWPVDAVLATGDLVHDPVAIAYTRLFDCLNPLDQPVFCLPGNHDDPELMYQLLNKNNVHTSKSIEIGHWLIIMLDSFLPNTHAGKLQQTELDMLNELLNEYRQQHVLVCLHHPPVEIGSEWMDSMRLENPHELFAVLDNYDHIKAVLWGHIHQEFNRVRNDVQLMATPSTCVQFMPETGEYRKDGRAAGYRYLKLHASGEIETQVRRLHENND